MQVKQVEQLPKLIKEEDIVRWHTPSVKYPMLFNLCLADPKIKHGFTCTVDQDCNMTN